VPTTIHEPDNAHDIRAIYDTHFQRIFNYILSRVGNVAEAEDLTAQTFMNALNALEDKRGVHLAVTPWLYRIATNEVNGYLRRGWKLQPLLYPEELAEERVAGERELARNQMFLALNEAMRALKPKYQTLIALRYFEQLSFADIAAIMGKREGALTMATHRALKKLANELGKRGIDHEQFRKEFDGSPAPGYPTTEIPAGTAT
jgi:RNA polymerase sigma-70 factor (ECF subfamily)